MEILHKMNFSFKVNLTKYLVNDRRYSASHAQLQEMAKNLNAYDD